MKNHSQNKIALTVLAVSSPIILFLLVLLAISFGRPDIMIVKDNTAVGCCAMLIHGDTVCVPIGQSLKRHKGKFFYFHRNNQIDTIFCIEEFPLLCPHIHDYTKGKNFILFDQIPMDSVFGRFVSWHENLGYVGRKNLPTSKKDSEAMIRTSNIHVYWILNKQTSDVYGPMSFEQYLAKKKDLGVPENLLLKYEKERLKE